MKRTAVAAAAILAALIRAATAQDAPDPSTLNDTEKLGQRLFYQSCGVCHTKPQLNAPQYGPVLSMATAGGNAQVIHDVIANGTPRMPGFKTQFDDTQINAIVAYLKKVPAPKP